MDPGRQFSEIYRREFGFVWAAARRLGVPSAVVEDAVQEVFLTAFRRLDHLRYEVSPRAWLYGVTRRVASRYRRTAARSARRVAAVASARRPDDGAPQEHVFAVQQIEGLIARLDPRLRTAFEMAELLGMSGPEIAAEVGAPISTVYSRIRLAREQLARDLDPRQLAHGLGAARAEDEPPRAAAQRGWLLLAPGLGRGAPGLAALLTVRGAVLTGLLLAGALVVIPPRGPASRSRVAAPSSAPDPASALAARSEPARAVTEPAATTEPALTTELAATTGLAATGAAPGAARERRSLARLDEPSADRIAAEVALLDRARAALGRHDDDAAGALLTEHAREFPDGVLVDLRLAVEIELLCRRGRDEQAASQARALVLAHPGSAVAQRLVDFSCPR